MDFDINFSELVFLHCKVDSLPRVCMAERPTVRGAETKLPSHILLSSGGQASQGGFPLKRTTETEHMSTQLRTCEHVIIKITFSSEIIKRSGGQGENNINQ